MNIFDKDRESLMFELIERHNGILLNRTFAVLSNFTNGTGVNGVDATIDVTSNDPTFYYNMKRINYGKLDLNDQLKLQTLTIPMSTGDTSWTLLPAINAKFGLLLTQDDIILSQIDTSVNPWKITIRCKPDSWIAKTNVTGLVFTRDVSTNHLRNPLKKLILTGLVPPSTDLTRKQGPLMTYPVFAANSAVPGNYAVGYKMQLPSANDYAIADIISAETGEVWGFQQSGYTLYGYEVIFNGLAATAKANGYHVNTDHNYVMILSCGNIGVVGGYVSVHY